MPDHEIAVGGARGAHVPEHPPVPGHDGAREPDRGPAQDVDEAPRASASRAFLGLSSLRRGGGRGASERARAWLEVVGLIERAERSVLASFPMAPSAASRSRAPCAPIPCSSASTSRRRVLNNRESAELTRLLRGIRKRDGRFDPAHRARHVGGDGHLGPHRRHRIRHQDLGRHGGQREERSQGHCRLSRRRRRGGGARLGSSSEHEPACFSASRAFRAYYGNISRFELGFARRPARRDRDAHRRQRRRQVDAHDDGVRDAGGARRPHPASRGAISSASSRTRSRSSTSPSRRKAGAFSSA